SERSDPGPQFFDSYSFPPWQLPGLIFPYFFGGAMLPPYGAPYWGKEIAAIMCGYVGMLTWLLALIAIFGGKLEVPPSGGSFVVPPEGGTTNFSTDRARVWLWLGVAVVSMLLAFGGYLPFGLNHQLYRIPGYSAFRGLYRHQFEFTFAMAMLAGLGMNCLIRVPKHLARRAFVRSAVVMTAIIIAVFVLYRFFAEALSSVNPLPVRANALTNPEFFVPIGFFVLSLIALWLSQILNLKSQIVYLTFIVILLLDVASYGHFFHWRVAEFDVEAKLADPPAVQLIKSREPDLNSLRVMSQMMLPYDYAREWPEDPNYEAINQPNISILRGLQSVSGYDILRPVRVGEITGTAGSAIRGFVQDPKSFGLDDRGLDLLNVKYLIVGLGGSTKGDHWLDHDGVKFARTNFSVEFKPGVNLTTDAGAAAADEIAVVSTMANSTHLPDGAPILNLRLHTQDGRVIERELQAGRDTSEWAYDRADVKAAIKHQRARVVESALADGFDSHFYLGRLQFDRAVVEKIEWIYAREDASLYLIRASLYDSQTGASTPLAAYSFPPVRWRKLARFDQVEVYENLRAAPRAWFVDQALAFPADEILKTIKTGVTPTQEPFDPARVALLEAGDENRARPAIGAAKNAQARITRYAPNRIELKTSNPHEGFLVLSEVYYQGWEARIDGAPTKIYRTDHTLRGIFVPAGDHNIEFVYRPQSLRRGAIGAAFGLMLLLLVYPMMRVLSGGETRSPK
ncbi:MAG: YfhO family protein, partial [Acidobacteria bacterium]|nr:YfhO family protein [Acidobacteriota bacterium]